MINVDYVTITFPDIDIKPSDIPKLRGYFARKFPQEHLFHNHLPDNTFSYKYPSIQYRVLGNKPTLLGINEGIDLIFKTFLKVDSIDINGKILETEGEMHSHKSKLGVSDQIYSYRFVSPWMGLNEKNHREYIKLSDIQKMNRLRQILRNNLKTLSKGFGYWIKDFNNVEVDGWFEPVQVNFKNLKMICFKGDFKTNFAIPNYLGIGKQCARGFGAVKRIGGNNDS